MSEKSICMKSLHISNKESKYEYYSKDIFFLMGKFGFLYKIYLWSWWRNGKWLIFLTSTCKLCKNKSKYNKQVYYILSCVPTRFNDQDKINMYFFNGLKPRWSHAWYLFASKDPILLSLFGILKNKTFVYLSKS